MSLLRFRSYRRGSKPLHIPTQMSHQCFKAQICLIRAIFQRNSYSFIDYLIIFEVQLLLIINSKSTVLGLGSVPTSIDMGDDSSFVSK